MNKVVPLQDLLQYITILILENNKFEAEGLKVNLESAGYSKIFVTGDPEKALEKLPQTNILLTDQVLHDRKWDGLKLTYYAKYELGADVEIILYSGVVKEIADEAIRAGAIAFLEKPFDFKYLKLWIDEIAKRIWLQKILDTVPDELAVIDKKQFGRILYANKSKKEKYESGRPLEGSNCWERFEVRGQGIRACKDCPSRLAFKEGRQVRTEWNYVSRATNVNESVDLFAAPLYDQMGRIRAVVESCRDRTMKMIVEKLINRIERVRNWEKRLTIFLEGFQKLGFKRVRFYQAVPEKDWIVFKGVKAVGMEDGFDIGNFQYLLSRDEPSQIVYRLKKPILFVVDKRKPNRKCEKARVFNYIYNVGDQNVAQNKILKKKKWIDIPILADGKIIAKVSIDNASEERFYTNYDLDLLGYYGMSAGQAIHNAQEWQKTKFKEDTERAIIEMAREITSVIPHTKLIQRAVRRVCHVMKTAGCSIFILEKSGKESILKRQTTYVIDVNGNHYSKLDFPEEYRIGASITGRVFQKDQNVYVNNVLQKVERERTGKTQGAINLAAVEGYNKVLGEPLRNAMFAVLQSEKGKIGIIRTINKRRKDYFGQTNFNEDDMKAFEALAGLIAIAIENANLVKDLENLQNARLRIIEDYSHTLKNFLQPVVTLSQLLYEKAKDHKDRKWQVLMNEISRLRTIVNTMLKLSQAEAGQKLTQLKPVEIEPLLSQVIEPYQLLAEDKKMTITTDCQPNLPTLLLDRQMVSDAVANLLDNAIKYGDSQTEITIEAFLRRNNFFIAVKNYGPEIPPEDQKRVFEKFYTRSEVVHSIVQLGLGLAYVQIVSDAHGGYAFVDPHFENGARVIMKMKV